MCIEKANSFHGRARVCNNSPAPRSCKLTLGSKKAILPPWCTIYYFWSTKRKSSSSHVHISIVKIFFFTVLAPVVMNYIERRNLLKKAKWAGGPIQVALCGVCLTFATPLCCALFAQKVAVPVNRLEPEVQEKIRAKDPKLEIAYYNKGLWTLPIQPRILVNWILSKSILKYCQYTIRKLYVEQDYNIEKNVLRGCKEISSTNATYIYKEIRGKSSN